ncbi:MAG: DNA-processing protein DprA [Pseudomonadota bacterium]|nr:MAG: DNA-processing protein DprA [Pseudomonadota bacterium]
MDATSQELPYWLALNRAPRIGPVAFGALLRAFDSPRQVFEAGSATLRECGLPAAATEFLARPDWRAVEADLAWLAEPGATVLTLSDADYPALLREMADPPPLLYVLGDTASLDVPQLAVVGSRRPTRTGEELAHGFGAELVRAGLAVTSGLALGIDAAAHRGALEAGGPTVAVAGTGLDRVYPARNRELAREIAGGGALVSEFAPGTRPTPGNFPRRNRVISGLSRGVLVVEAALESGSLITARFALEQGREVFALPGSVYNPQAKGCHALIRDGAKLVESVAHVLEELGGWESVGAAPVAPGAPRGAVELDAEQRKVLDCIGFEPTAIDVVVERSGLTAETVCSILLVLELQGLVVSGTGGQYCRAT